MRWEEKRFKDCKHFKQGMAHAAAVQNEEERTCSSGSSLACAGGAAVLQFVPRLHVHDDALPWFCRGGLPSDHLPLEFAFKFLKRGDEDCARANVE